MRSENDLERMIDRALREYAEARPVAGIEDRVLRRVQASPARRPSFGWAVGGLIAAAGAIAMFWMAPVAKTPSSAGKPVVKVAQMRDVVIEQSKTVRPPVRAARRRALPKREYSPSPQPITGEERALLSLVERDPSGASQLFADLRKRASEPVKIDLIEIAPLASDSAQ